MYVRPYAESDALDTLDVFLRAVHETASRDYTAEQVTAWADIDRNPIAWHQTRAAANTQVAEVDGQIVGFTDLSADGYIDMLFVDPAHLRKGVASALIARAEATARATGIQQLCTHASSTARPFFEAYGFTVEEERTRVVRGVGMTNYRMRFPLM